MFCVCSLAIVMRMKKSSVVVYPKRMSNAFLNSIVKCSRFMKRAKEWCHNTAHYCQEELREKERHRESHKFTIYFLSLKLCVVKEEEVYEIYAFFGLEFGKLSLPFSLFHSNTISMESNMVSLFFVTIYLCIEIRLFVFLLESNSFSFIRKYFVCVTFNGMTFSCIHDDWKQMVCFFRGI